MTPLESRKRLLVAESDLNRAQLIADIHELRSGLDHFLSRVSLFRTLASLMGTAVKAFSALRTPANGSHGGVRSGWASVLRGFEFGLSLWRMFRRS